MAIHEYLASLVEDLETAMRAEGRPHVIRLQADQIQLATDKAVSLGVIATELITNAYKHAYPEGVTGEIRVELRRIDAEQASLVIEDDGIGFGPDDTARGTGLGTRIVSAMASNLQSAVTYDPAHRDTRATISFPI